MKKIVTFALVVTAMAIVPGAVVVAWVLKRLCGSNFDDWGPLK
jgi:hypothetical protein